MFTAVKNSLHGANSFRLTLSSYPIFRMKKKRSLRPFISMIAPSSDNRIKMISKDAKGFLYCVSSMGVTGVRSDIKTDVGAMIKNVREVSDVPTAIGFGISTPEQARHMAQFADGVIVGSAIVKLCAQYGKDCVEPVKAYVKEIKAAIAAE